MEKIRNGLKHKVSSHFTYGADGGGRTHTMLPSRDFESRASANSTTSAKIVPNYNITIMLKCQYKKGRFFQNDLLNY